MKLYLASSWANSYAILDFAKFFRLKGHEVYAFPEHVFGNFTFNWTDIINPNDDGITCLKYWQAKQAFASDKKHMDWADACILFLPAGRDSHLEGGYIKGRGGKLFIVGAFPKGEFSNTYQFADGLFRLTELNKLLEVLNNG